MPPDYDNDVDEASGFSSDEDFDFEPGPPLQSSRKWDLCMMTDTLFFVFIYLGFSSDSDEKVDVGLCQTRQGVKIQVMSIPDAILEKMDYFYVCEDCGKVYWDGSHMERVLTGRLQGIVQ